MLGACFLTKRNSNNPLFRAKNYKQKVEEVAKSYCVDYYIPSIISAISYRLKGQDKVNGTSTTQESTNQGQKQQAQQQQLCKQ